MEMKQHLVIDKEKKVIVIPKDSPVREIYISSTLSYMWRENETEKRKVVIGGMSGFMDYTIISERIHLLKTKESFTIHNDCGEYPIWLLRKSGVIAIVYNCLEPNIEVAELAKRLSLRDIAMAEIGFKFFVTTIYLLSALDIKSYDMYDCNHFVCRQARRVFAGDGRVEIYEGRADEMLKTHEKTYDYVFFDCTHRYDTDYVIIKELIPHLRKDSIVIFHDYTMLECHALIDDFASWGVCETYAINNINALDKARGEIIKVGGV